MPETGLVHPLDAVRPRLTPAPHAGLRVTVEPSVAIVQIMARRGMAGRVGKSLAIGQYTTAFEVAPARWLALAPEGRDGSLAAQLHKRLAGLAYIADHSHANVAMTLEGPSARAVLAKGCGLDLERLPAGTGTRAKLEAFPIFLRCRAPEQGYQILVAASVAESFWHWLEEATIDIGLAAHFAD